MGEQSNAATESPLHAEVRTDLSSKISVRYKQERLSSAVHTCSRSRDSHTSTDSGRTSLCNEWPLTMWYAVHTTNGYIPFELLMEGTFWGVERGTCEPRLGPWRVGL